MELDKVKDRGEGLDTQERNTKAEFTKWHKIMAIIITVVVCAIVAGVVTFAVGLYKLDWANKYEDNNIVRKVIEIAPFPVALIDMYPATFNDYMITKESILSFYQSQYGVDFATDEGAELKMQIEQEILDRVIDNTIAKKLAGKYDVVVTSAEVNSEYQAVISESQGEDVEGMIADIYGLSLKAFKSKVLKDSLLQGKLAEKITNEFGYKEEARFKAQEILDSINSEETTFEVAATENSDDPSSALAGGELGWIAKGVTVPEFEIAAFELEAGETSGLVETQFGFHIIRVDEKKGEGDTEEVKVSHILVVAKSFQDWLNEQKEDMKITKLITL